MDRLRRRELSLRKETTTCIFHLILLIRLFKSILGVISHTLQGKDVAYVFQNMNHDVIAIIELAQTIAKDMQNAFIGSEHILLALLKSKRSPLRNLLSPYQVTYQRVKEDLVVLFDEKEEPVEYVKLTKTVEVILELTILHALHKGKEEAELEDLIICLFSMEKCVAYEILRKYDVDIEEVMKGMLESNTMNELTKIKELTNLNAKMGATEQVVLGREKEIEKLIMILCRKEKSNPLLIGEPGIGKTAIVEEVARRIARKQVPASIENLVIFELNVNNLVAGTKYRGEFEEKIDRVCGLVKKYPNAVLFIDEAHQIIGAGKAEGSIDAATVFKPYLARSELKVIGATTMDEYTKYIEKDRALDRRFQTIIITEPTAKETVEMIKNKIQSLFNYHSVMMEAGLIENAVHFSEKYLPTRHFPDKAIDVIDMACVKTKMKRKKTVTREEVTQVIEDLTNISLNRRARIQQLKDYLQYHYVGHSHIISQVVDSIHQCEFQTSSNHPYGIWCFAGPSSIGKSYLAKCIAEGYFNSETSLIHLNMELYKEANSLYYLTSSKDSIHHQPWSQIRKNPQCVLLLEHFNHAHLEVQTFFAKALEEGGWKDGKGIWIDLKSALVILSVNTIQKEGIGFHKDTIHINEIKSMLPSFMYYLIEEFFLFGVLQKEDYFTIARQTLEHCEVCYDVDKLEEYYALFDQKEGIRGWLKAMKKYMVDIGDGNIA